MTETKTNISYNPSLAAGLASNLLFIYSAQRITLAPETPGISAEQAPLWEAHNSRAAGGGSLLCAAGRAAISLLGSSAFAGVLLLIHENKRRDTVHMFSPFSPLLQHV